jgi:hypothetical protein
MTALDSEDIPDERWGQGFGPAAGLLAGAERGQLSVFEGDLSSKSAERKLSGRAEALTPQSVLTAP